MAIEKGPFRLAPEQGHNTENLTERPNSNTGFVDEVVKCAAKHDGLFFDKHPKREFRFRPARVGEAPGISAGDYLLIRRIEGGRLALLCRPPGTRQHTKKHMPTDDRELYALWVLVCFDIPFYFEDGLAMIPPVPRG